MADKNQLKILKEEGVEVWNKWLEENRYMKIEDGESWGNWQEALEELQEKYGHVKIDLFRAKLHEADLSDAHLSGGDLRKADLSGAKYLGKINCIFCSKILENIFYVLY